MKEIDAGQPAAIVVPNAFHRLDAKIFSALSRCTVYARDSAQKSLEIVAVT